MLGDEHSFIGMPGEAGRRVGARPVDLSVADQPECALAGHMLAEPGGRGRQRASDGVAREADQVPVNGLGRRETPVAVGGFDGLAVDQCDPRRASEV